MGLAQRLADAARAGISFRDWMEACLYDPEEGYYTRTRSTPRTGIGPEADFATSPTLHPFMAQCVADEALAAWDSLGRPEDFRIAEFGGGLGDLARDALDRLERAGLRPEWLHVEVAPDHQAAQRGSQTVAPMDRPHGRPKTHQVRASAPSAAAVSGAGVADDGVDGADVAGADVAGTHTAQLPEAPRIRHVEGTPIDFVGLVVAHEFLDALPVHLLQWGADHWQELYVEGDPPRLVPREPSAEALAAAPDLRARPGQVVAAAAAVRRWIHGTATAMARGCILVVDYGAEGERLWARDPEWGTVRTFAAHADAGSPLTEPGRKDITASIDFAQLRNWAAEAGAREAWNGSQEAFLLEHGALEALNSIDRSTLEGASAYLRLRHMLIPHAGGMGHAFRVARYEKGMG